MTASQYGTWASDPNSISLQLVLPSGQNFHDFFHDLSQSPTVSCNANRAPGSNPANPGCCQAPGIDSPDGQSFNPTDGGPNCQAGCLCCIAFQLQNAGAQRGDIDTYINSVINAGCNGNVGGILATDISQICNTNSSGCYTGHCTGASCTAFIPGPYSGSSCPGVSSPSWFKKYWVALVIAAIVILLLLGGTGYYVSRRRSQ